MSSHEMADQFHSFFKLLHRGSFQSLHVNRSIAGAQPENRTSLGYLIQRCRRAGKHRWMTKDHVGYGNAEKNALGQHRAAGQGLEGIDGAQMTFAEKDSVIA